MTTWAPSPSARDGGSTARSISPTTTRTGRCSTSVRRDASAGALGDRVHLLEHVGSTSVPGLAAKPIIDMLLVVADSADEPEYVPPMDGAGYAVRIREPDWQKHRVFRGPDTDINLHTFSDGSSEIERMLAFRDWLRTDRDDRDLYLRTKRALAARHWVYVQDYADAKGEVVEAIIARALAGRASAGPR